MFPLGPSIGEKSTPINAISENPEKNSLMEKRTEMCISFSLITPFLPTAPLPASNWGFTRHIQSPGDASTLSTAGMIFLSEIKETSITANWGDSGRWPGSRFRALNRSIIVTLGSFLKRQANWPYPTSTAKTLLAPRDKRTSVKPPVEAPTSMQTLSTGSMLKTSSAFSNL